MKSTAKNPIKKVPSRLFSQIVATLTKSKGRPIAIIYLLLISIIYTNYGSEFLGTMHNPVFDTYQVLFPKKVERLPVVIVDIDDASLAAFGRWPWPRTRLSELVENAHQLGATAIGFDIIMPEPDSLSPDIILSNRKDIAPSVWEELKKLPSNDEILVQTLKKNPSVVGRAALIDSDQEIEKVSRQTSVRIFGESPMEHVPSYNGHVKNIPEIENAAFGWGYLNDTRDEDGVVRSMPLLIKVNGELAPALSLEMLRTSIGVDWYSVHTDKSGVQGIKIGESFIPTDKNGSIRIYFSPAFRARRVSALSVLNGELSAGSFAKQLVIIGVTGVGTIDVVSTPVAARMDGVEIQAQVIENILDNSRLIRPFHGSWIELGAFILLAIVLIVFIPRIYPGYAILLFLASVGLIIGVCLAAFSRSMILYDPSFPIIGNVVILIVQLTAGFSASNRERRELDAALEIEKLERIRMSGELKAAREIQMGILPAPGSIEGLPPNLEFHAMVEPADEVGGDLYDAFMIDDRHFFFIVGDVSGKGVPASLFMALSKTLCKSIALRGYSPLNDLINDVNGEISRENHAMLFVTAVVGIIDMEKGELQICSAGHDSPILIREGTPIKFLNIAGGPPLCVLDDYNYSNTNIPLKPNDMLVLISDGITEAQDLDENFYGKERILNYLDGLKPTEKYTPKSVCRGLYEDVKLFTKSAVQFDDITIMVIRFT
ncbi:CHASE2 domain-containing protein [Thermodesulfobacteriota bacterium]